MIGRAGVSSKCWRVLRWVGLAAAAPALWACTSRTLEAPTIQPTATVSTLFTQKINNNIDILFMIDNSSSMTSMQKKLYDQLPTFITQLSPPNIPMMPSLQIGVVSSDMGAPGDSDSSIGCTAYGDQGWFQSSPRSSTPGEITPNVVCTNSTIAIPMGQTDSNHTYLDDVMGMTNFTDPLSTVFQCIALLGDQGCGFEHQLASIDRALGGDGSAPPSQNQNFLRDGAYLGIVILTNEDDCSASGGQNTTLFSLNGGQQALSNPLGPIANYRCNQFGHLCQDPAMGNMVITPPLNPPSDVMMTGTTPTLDLASCTSNDTSSGMLTPVSQFINDIKQLKPDPDNQILVAAITAPADPYSVEWVPGMGTVAGELWPQVEHSCGAKGGNGVNPLSTMSPTDGSFGDPGVRISQFVEAFPNSVLASICDPSYASSMTAIAKKIGALITPPCITGQIQNDSMGQPECSVIENVENNGVFVHNAIPNCNENNNVAPCWTMATGVGNCTGSSLMVNDTMANAGAEDENSTVNCSLCLPVPAGQKPVPGC